MGISYGLLRLPKMPEVKEWRERVKKQKGTEETDADVQVSSGLDWSDREVDVSRAIIPPLFVSGSTLNELVFLLKWDSFGYLDKARETHRQQEMVVAAGKREETNAQRRKEAELRHANAKKFEAWSEKVEAKERKLLRREKKDRKKDWEAKEEKRLQEEGGGLAGTPRAALHKKKQEEKPPIAPLVETKPAVESDDEPSKSSGDEASELEEDYKEVRNERTKKHRPTGGLVGGDMFDDMM